MVLTVADPYRTPGPLLAALPAATDTAAPAELAPYLMDGCYRPPADLVLDDWLAHGQLLSRRWAALLWLLADWARCGIDFYGPAAWTYLAATTGRDRDTLRKMVVTSRRFPPQRRRLAVPFSRHSAVAALPDDAADWLLARAEQEGWIQQDLVRAVRAYRGQPTEPKSRRSARQAAPAGLTTTTAIVTPAVNGHRQTAPIRCSGCMLTCGYAIGARAVVTTGPVAAQRVEGGHLVLNTECTSCKSTTLISLGALEIPTAAGPATGAS